MKVQFEYTFPIEKSEERPDGVYITGLATGPEIDEEGERIAPEAIAKFARQIEEMANFGLPLTYRDAHIKDGVLTELGEVTKAWLTPEFHLGVEVRLDVEDNPAALSLWKKIQKGKQYGMSVAGEVHDFADEFVSDVGRIVRTYKDVVLTEISNTTRPAWTPSFGTVLSKAIKDAESSDAAGDSTRMDKEKQDRPAVEGNGPEPVGQNAGHKGTTDATRPETNEDVVGTEAAEQIAGQDTEATQVSPPDVTNDVNNNVAQRGGDALEAPNADGPNGPAMNEPTPDVLEDQNPVVEKAVAAIRELFTSLLREAAVGGITKSVSEGSESTAGLTALQGQVAELQRSLSEATARIAELENSPDGADAPELMERHELTVEQAREVIAKSGDTRQRLALGLREALGPRR